MREIIQHVTGFTLLSHKPGLKDY